MLYWTQQYVLFLYSIYVPFYLWTCNHTIVHLLLATTPTEPCEWLNKLLLDIWPNYIESKLSKKFQSTVEVNVCIHFFTLHFVLGSNLAISSSKGFSKSYIEILMTSLLHLGLLRKKSLVMIRWRELVKVLLMITKPNIEETEVYIKSCRSSFSILQSIILWGNAQVPN
jgi:hypothetical protein